MVVKLVNYHPYNEIPRNVRLSYLLMSLLPAIRSLERAKGEVFLLPYVFFVFLFVCSVNDFSTTRGPIHAKVCMQAYSGSGCVFSPFGVSGRRRRGG